MSKKKTQDDLIVGLVIGNGTTESGICHGFEVGSLVEVFKAIPSKIKGNETIYDCIGAYFGEDNFCLFHQLISEKNLEILP